MNGCIRSAIGAGMLAWVVVMAGAPVVQTAPGATSLNGAVTVNGKGLEGVAISAKVDGRTVTTTVFSDGQGHYRFPVLPAGSYRVWAQAVGFATARADAVVGEGASQRRDFALQPIADLTMQVSGSEWLAALPAATKEQRRLREIFRANCTMCHTPAVVLQQRFDEQGWRAIIDFMLARFVQPTSFSNPVDKNTTMVRHRDELAKYLASVRGPNSPSLTFTPQPRPTGEATRVVITEWDIPFANHADGLAWFDGSDWSEGTATSGSRDMSLHDVVIDDYGNAWLTSFGSMTSTIYHVDITNGQVTGFNLPGPNGRARISHGMERDPKGLIWFDMFGTLGRIDPATQTLSVIKPPANLADGPSISTDTDKTGKVWSSTRYGAIRYDPETGSWLYLQNVTVADGLSYGNAVDADGNGWWAQFQADRLGKGDPKTGKSYEVIMRPPWVKDEEDVLTAEDKAFYKSVGALSWGKINSIPGAQAPRRMGADKNGDTVWAANFLGNNLVGVNMRSLDAKYYRVPMPGHPYRVDVDADHNAWTNLHSDDRILKLNPQTGKWTVYRTPGNGCETRHIHVDQRRNEVWVPCHRTGKVVRMQFTNGAASAPGRSERAPAPAANPGGLFQRVAFDMKQVAMPAALTEAQVRGRKLFTQRCAACHDPSEVLTGYGPKLTGARLTMRGDAAVRATIAQGSARMPGFRHMLSDEQVSLIVDYLGTR